MTAEETIDKRQDEQKALLIEKFHRTPIIQVACEKTGISRASYYRWRKEDESFAKLCDEAMHEGVELINDLAESKLITAINEQNQTAMSFWLRHRHPAYAEKLQIQAKVEADVSMSAEQEEFVRQALARVAGTFIPPHNTSNYDRLSE